MIDYKDDLEDENKEEFDETFEHSRRKKKRVIFNPLFYNLLNFNILGFFFFFNSWFKFNS